MHDFDKVIDRRGTDSAKWDTFDKIYSDVKGLIHMGCADSDFESPKEIIDELNKTVNHGVFGYTDLSDEFYNGIISWQKERNNIDVKREEIVFCPRINISCGLCVEAFSQKGDEILINSPVYPPLKDAVVLNDRVIKEIPLVLQGDSFIFDFDALENAITEKTKMFILVSPHNPTSRVWTKEELEKIADICVKHNIILYVDEIHSDLLKCGVKFTSSLAIKGLIENNLIMTHSVAKTFNVPGAIISYLIIRNKKLRDALQAQINRIGMNNPSIFANAIMRVAFQKCAYYVEEVKAYIDANEEYFKKELQKIFPKAKFIKREGTYLLFVSFKDVAPEDKIFDFFLKKARVEFYRGSHFGKDFEGYMRINIATPRKTLCEAITRIKENLKYLEV